MKKQLQKILFCRIAWMSKYQDSEPNVSTGGSFVKEEGYGCEEYNFYDYDGKHYGFIETNFRDDGTKKCINIQRLGGDAKSLKVKGVIVVWCATKSEGKTYIVGWYKDATVYRDFQENHSQYGHSIEAESKNCFLVPQHNRDFQVVGIGQKAYWYAENNIELKREVLGYISDYVFEKKKPKLNLKKCKSRHGT